MVYNDVDPRTTVLKDLASKYISKIVCNRIPLLFLEMILPIRSLELEAVLKDINLTCKDDIPSPERIRKEFLSEVPLTLETGKVVLSTLAILCLRPTEVPQGSDLCVVVQQSLKARLDSDIDARVIECIMELYTDPSRDCYFDTSETATTMTSFPKITTTKEKIDTYCILTCEHLSKGQKQRTAQYSTYLGFHKHILTLGRCIHDVMTFAREMLPKFHHALLNGDPIVLHYEGVYEIQMGNFEEKLNKHLTLFREAESKYRALAELREVQTNVQLAKKKAEQQKKHDRFVRKLEKENEEVVAKQKKVEKRKSLVKRESGTTIQPSAKKRPPSLLAWFTAESNATKKAFDPNCLSDGVRSDTVGIPIQPLIEEDSAKAEDLVTQLHTWRAHAQHLFRPDGSIPVQFVSGNDPSDVLCNVASMSHSLPPSALPLKRLDTANGYIRTFFQADNDRWNTRPCRRLLILYEPPAALDATKIYGGGSLVDYNDIFNDVNDSDDEWLDRFEGESANDNEEESDQDEPDESFVESDDQQDNRIGNHQVMRILNINDEGAPDASLCAGRPLFNSLYPTKWHDARYNNDAYGVMPKWRSSDGDDLEQLLAIYRGPSYIEYQDARGEGMLNALFALLQPEKPAVIQVAKRSDMPVDTLLIDLAPIEVELRRPMKFSDLSVLMNYIRKNNAKPRPVVISEFASAKNIDETSLAKVMSIICVKDESSASDVRVHPLLQQLMSSF